jgi:Na+-transporting NADH:ubiquinone oxidoreductase subunit NqrD
MNIRKEKWNTIRMVIPKFIIIYFVIWVLNILITFLKTGELKITDKIFISVILAFCLTFGELTYEKKNK